jgi:predicted N-formylglutamate amidohydrolase
MNAGSVIVTCEHATAAVPTGFEQLFESDPRVLHTHRAYDPGAAATAIELARRLGCPFPAMGTCSRLLIDLNRSLRNPRVFSEFSPAPGDGRRDLLIESYHQYRDPIAKALAVLLDRGFSAIHFSVHTFTPWLAGQQRRADIGLLFDPTRARERAICEAIRRRMHATHPGYRVRFNYPYRGSSDGLTRSLREQMGESYAGIELELNHAAYMQDHRDWTLLSDALVSAIYLALHEAA